MHKLVPVLLLAAACGPSLKPAMVSRTNQWVTDLSAKNAATYPAPEGSGAEPKVFPWAVGQWIAFKVSNEKNEVSVMKIALVGKEPRGWWMETETQTGYGRDISKVLFGKTPGEVSPEQFAESILIMVTKHDEDEVQTIDLSTMPAFVQGMQRSVMKQSMKQSMPMSKFTAERTSATVTAGTFTGAYRFEAEDTTGYWHPLVPINGMLKAATRDGKFSMELIGFGIDATSALP